MTKPTKEYQELGGIVKHKVHQVRKICLGG
jgi:hypothetical protein